MSMTQSEIISAGRVGYGGFIDAAGGIATMVLAIIGLTGTATSMLLSIVTIIFGAALLIQGGAMLSEYARFIFPEGAEGGSLDQFGGGTLSAVFLAGASGVVLGVLALLGNFPGLLSSIAVIAFGVALVLSSNSVMHLQHMRMMSMRSSRVRNHTGSEILAAEMATGSAGIQALAGLAAIILGILSVTATVPNPTALGLVALLGLGATLVMTGTTLSGVVQGFMHDPIERREA